MHQEQTKESPAPSGARRVSSVPAIPGRRKGESSERLCALGAAGNDAVGVGAASNGALRPGLRSGQRRATARTVDLQV